MDDFWKIIKDCEDLIQNLGSDIPNKVIRELIRNCDDIINGLESDIKQLKGSKRKKRSKSNKEVKKLIRECDDLINSLESDLKLLKGSKRKKISKYNKEIRKLIRECDDLINDIELDLSLGNKGKGVNDYKNVSTTFQKPRKIKKQKNKSDVSKIKDEVLNIVSINARGVARKKKSIEEILKNENVDVAIISELSVKTVLKFKGYREFVEIRGHMHGICILMRNDIAKHALRIHKESELEVVHVRLSNTVPALNIIGTYLNVESREKADDINKTWNSYTEMVQQVLDRGEACICMGDFNRPMQAKKPTLGTRLLNEWIEGGTIKLIIKQECYYKT